MAPGTVWSEWTYLVELTFPGAGHDPFVSHVMVDAERGAHGSWP